MGEVRRDYVFRGGRYASLFATAALTALLVALPNHVTSDSSCLETPHADALRPRSAVAIDGAAEACACVGERPDEPSTLRPAPEDSLMPLYVSPSTDFGTYHESFEARRNEGWATGLYMYWPGDMEWTSDWEKFVSRHPEGIPVVGSPKSVNPTSVHGFFGCLPQAWRDEMIVAYYQEPEDDFTTIDARGAFRERVSDMADMVRPYGVRNAVHLQEWTINPNNQQEWAGEENLAQFINVEDLDYISWSLYPPEGTSMREGIDRIREFSEEHAPGVPWGITAAGSPVKTTEPLGSPARENRARIVEEAARYIAEVGGSGYGWFDFDEYRPGRDQLVSKDPALQDAMLTAAGVLLSGP